MKTKQNLYFQFRTVLTIVLFSLYSQMCFATWFSASPLEFFVEKPGKDPKWIAGPIPGIPLILLGPSVEGFRPGLSFIPESKPSNTKIDLKVMKEGFDLYKDGRDKYVSVRKGKVEKYLDPFRLKNNNGLEIFGVGYIYELAGQRIIEKSLRFNCNGHAVMSVYRAQDYLDKQFYTKFENVLASLKCRGTK